MKNIEVELRGPLDEAAYAVLQKYLKENGKVVSIQKRLFFDLSQTIGINNRSLDVRAKVTDGDVHIVVKKAEPGSVSREEAEISIKEGGLERALHILALLGYPKGVYGNRHIARYNVQDVEFAIQDVIGISDGQFHSRFFEAEILAHPGEEKEMEEKLRDILSGLGLHVFENAAWDAYEKKLNAEANGWFDFHSTDISGLGNS